MIRRFLPTMVVTEAPSQGWGDLFEVRPLLPGPYSYLEAGPAWDALWPTLEGRRVVMVGRAAEAAYVSKPPPMRWLQLGRAGEPAEVMWLPGSVDPWRNSADNRALVDEWMAEERKRADDIARAWCSIPGTNHVYWFARGHFSPKRDGRPTYAPLMPNQQDEVRRALTTCVAGLNRFGGGGWNDVRHALLVRAALPPNSPPVRRRKALTHDHHEMPVSDLSTPLKRIIGPAWREVEQDADSAVEQLYGIVGLTTEDRHAVKVADQVALRLEARALGIDLGDPAELHHNPGSLELVRQALAANPDPVGSWWAAWRADGG